MSEYGLIDKAILDGIGDAVREKTGGTEEIPVNGLAEEIRGLNAAREPYAEEIYDNKSGTLISSNIVGARFISPYKFYNSSNLISVSIPENVTSIGGYAFYKCTNLVLTKFPTNLRSINSGAFTNCKCINITKFPEILDAIGTSAFSGCTGLTNITFTHKPSNIATNAFENCTNLVTINVPWSEGEVEGAPWGATNATINYNYVPPTENDGESGEEE